MDPTSIMTGSLQYSNLQYNLIQKVATGNPTTKQFQTYNNSKHRHRATPWNSSQTKIMYVKDVHISEINYPQLCSKTTASLTISW